MSLKVIGLLIIFSFLFATSLAETFVECDGKDNMYIGSAKSCSHYILCYGDDSFEGECEADTPYFSEVDQTCDTDNSVCKNATLPDASTTKPPSGQDGDIDGPVAPTLSPTNTTVATTITVTVPTTIKPPTVSTLATSSLMPSNTTVSVPTIQTTTAATHIASECPSQDDPTKIVFLPDTKSCSDYFMCYHGEPLAMHCSNMLHFDLKTQKCDYPENVKCQLDSASPREKCQIHTVDVYPHPTNCNYYYLCRYGYLMIMQCPSNMDWDEEKRACVLRPKAKCKANVQERLVMGLF